MKRFLRSLGLMAMTGLLALAQSPTASFEDKIRIGGSTTLLPVIADCASRFMETFDTWDKVDPSFPKKKILIFVTGGGSGFGINAVNSGTVDLGMSSRDLKEQEKANLGAHKAVLVSKDCIAFAVSRQSPLAKVDNLTAQDVVRIFTGEAKTFQDLRNDLPKKPILVQMRDMSGGSTEIVQSLILKQKTFTTQAVQVPSQGANLTKLETNPAAVGFLSSVMAMQSRKLKVFKFEGVLPTNENVISGTYRVTRPLLMVKKGQPSVQEQKFLDFLLKEGQAVVREHGYVPVNQLK
jgi:phosphate transport system substrate-binding protein